jgi:predicted anti-sigma-YlaC factor YlaD
MWNLLRTKKDQVECRRLRDELEGSAEVAEPLLSQQEHLAACSNCQAVADDIAKSRIFLREVTPPAMQPGPWFAPRVMAAIAARESELRQSLEAWAAVPRFAARLTWISALALLLAGGWLYESPTLAPTSGNQTTAESLFDSPQSQTPDDVLPMELAQ